MTATRKQSTNSSDMANLGLRVDQLQTDTAQVDVSDLTQLDGKVAVLTTGAQTIAGQKTFSNMPIWPRATVAATGSTLADAAQLTSGFTSVTASDSTKGVKLPATPAAGTVVIVKNTVAGQTLKVWPDAAATINAIGANGAIALAAVAPAIFIADSTTQWYTIPLLPS